MSEELTDAKRRAIRRDAIGLGIGTGAYALSFGALSVSAGLSIWQTQALSLLMFTGASQFALIAILGAGGGAVVAVATAALVGSRNAFYSVHMTRVLRPSGWRRLAAAQLTIDESTGMAVGHDETNAGARLAFWSTGIAIFICWNVGTLIGAVAAGLLDDPAVLGLDAAGPAAFLALIWPRLTSWSMRAVFAVSMVFAVAFTPFLRPGIPVLIAGAAGVVTGLLLALPELRRARGGGGA